MHLLAGIVLLILFWGQIIQRVCRTFFIEELDVFCHITFNVFIARNMKIIKYFRFNPPVDCLHGCIISWCTGTGHRMNYVIQRQQIVKTFRSINRALIGVQHHFESRIFFLDINQSVQPADISHPVSPFG